MATLRDIAYFRHANADITPEPPIDSQHDIFHARRLLPSSFLILIRCWLAILFLQSLMPSPLYYAATP